MPLLAEQLTPIARADHLLCIIERGGLVEAVAELLGNYGPKRGLVAALALVDILQQPVACVYIDAPLENAQDAALVQLLVDDGIRVRVAPDLPGLPLVIRKLSVGDVVHEGLCPRWHFPDGEDALVHQLGVV